MRKLPFLIGAIALLMQASTASADLTYIEGFNLLHGSTIQGYSSIYHTGIGDSALGDTYGAQPLAQDGTSAFFISDSSGPGAGVFTLGANPELHGANLTGAAGDTFSVLDAETDLGGGNKLIQVEIVSLDLNGGATPWVAAGVVSPNGPFTSWRMDVGGFAAAADLINPDEAFTVNAAGVSLFDSTGGLLGTFGLAVDLSDATGLGGVGVVGLGGADIAGFDMASMQMFFDIQFATIPEPTTIGLLSIVGLGLVIRRKR